MLATNPGFMFIMENCCWKNCTTQICRLFNPSVQNLQNKALTLTFNIKVNLKFSSHFSMNYMHYICQISIILDLNLLYPVCRMSSIELFCFFKHLFLKYIYVALPFGSKIFCCMFSDNRILWRNTHYISWEILHPGCAACQNVLPMYRLINSIAWWKDIHTPWPHFENWWFFRSA